MILFINDYDKEYFDDIAISIYGSLNLELTNENKDFFKIFINTYDYKNWCKKKLQKNINFHGNGEFIF